MIGFRFLLEGAQESPINMTPLGRGVGYALFDPVSGNLSYSFQVSGLDMGPLFGLPAQSVPTPDNVTLMHFHNAPRGTNGGVVFDIKTGAAADDDLARTAAGLLSGFPIGAPGNQISGVWENGESGNSIAPFVAALTAATPGLDVPLYVNIHTVQKGGGELRGQLVGMSTENADIINGDALEDILLGLGGIDTINGNDGDDRISGGAGSDLINGGAGSNTLFFFQGEATGTVIVDLANNYAAHNGEFDLLTNIQNADGGGFDDFLLGAAGANILTGLAGTDALLGGFGNDTLFGGDGNRDYLMGGQTYDPTELETGDDTMFGEGGVDVIYSQDGNDTIDGGADGDFVLAGAGNDILMGGAGDDFLFAGSAYEFNAANAGNDRTHGGDGVDFMVGGQGNDELNGDGGNDIIYGGDGTDRINTPTFMHDHTAGDGDDNLFGEGGNDLISGGMGFDYIRGGTGADTFIFRLYDSFDQIFDWSIAEGDKLRIDPLFGVTSFADFQSRLTGFTFEGTEYSVLYFPVYGDQMTIGGIRPDQWTAGMLEIA